MSQRPSLKIALSIFEIAEDFCDVFCWCACQRPGLDSEHLDGAQEEDGECHRHRWPEVQPQISPVVAPLLVTGGRERSCKCSQPPGSRLAAMQLHYHHVEHLPHRPAGWQLGNLFLVVLLIKVSSAQLEISHGGLTVPNMLARPDSLYHKWGSNLEVGS